MTKRNSGMYCMYKELSGFSSHYFLIESTISKNDNVREQFLMIYCKYMAASDEIHAIFACVTYSYRILFVLSAIPSTSNSA